MTPDEPRLADMARSMNSTHTPGPWRFRAPPTADNGNPWVVLDRDSHVLAIVSCSPREANAHLIAAAPELIEALHASAGLLAFLRACIESGETLSTDDQRTYAAVRSGIVAALAKAEGRQP